mmetsp:Transcript_95413/g.274796  ORF Transcript_95413/g.274796 Transcript_95413/m.274796 type:complete len:202 (+) Transcript_95413:2195-2800(+)
MRHGQWGLPGVYNIGREVQDLQAGMVEGVQVRLVVRDTEKGAWSGNRTDLRPLDDEGVTIAVPARGADLPKIALIAVSALSAAHRERVAVLGGHPPNTVRAGVPEHNALCDVRNSWRCHHGRAAGSTGRANAAAAASNCCGVAYAGSTTAAVGRAWGGHRTAGSGRIARFGGAGAGNHLLHMCGGNRAFRRGHKWRGLRCG